MDSFVADDRESLFFLKVNIFLSKCAEFLPLWIHGDKATNRLPVRDSFGTLWAQLCLTGRNRTAKKRAARLQAERLWRGLIRARLGADRP